MTKILLLNFSAPDAAVLSKAGYDVERGFLGPYEPQKYWPYQILRPIYEYDILVFNSLIASELQKEFVQRKNLLAERGSLQALTNFTGTPTVRISFISEYTGLLSLSHGGTTFVDLSQAEQNVSAFIERDLSRHTFAIAEIHRLIVGLKTDIEKVGYFLEASDCYPFYHFPSIVSRSGQQIAAYGTSYNDGQTIPSYIVLPQLRNTSRALIEILQTLEDVFPVLFPDRTKHTWLAGSEFLLPEERAKQTEIDGKVKEAVAMVESLRAERDELGKQNDFIRQLLIATEDAKVEKPERLSSLVRKALEFLEFTVEDIDEKTKTAIKNEDFWVRDKDFFAITEVTGTTNTNPKVKEFNDILGRITTIYKRKTDLLPDGVTNVSGLLVLNYDCERHPTKRPKAYTGELEHIVETAEEQNIGLLSTVELHKILVAVKDGRLTKQGARSILKKSGRIEYVEQPEKKKAKQGE